MIILLLFAFLAGVVTILSPCILPVLPIVLSGGITGDKKRPFGIVVGFIASFSFFTLFLTSIVNRTGISADFVRMASVGLIFFFGLTQIVPSLQVVSEKILSRLIPQKNASSQHISPSFQSGFLLGISLGLLWTPCVGPILASVIALALTGSVNGSAMAITIAYATGTAIPLLGVMMGGRSLFSKHSKLLANTPKIQKAFGVIMIVTSLSLAFGLDRAFQTFIIQKFPNYGTGLTIFEDIDIVRKQLSAFGTTPMPAEKRGKILSLLGQNIAPELIPGGMWFNTEQPEKGLRLSDLKGKVVLVDFWTYTCINCIRTLPYIERWHKKYKDMGLVIIGVHTPEFEFEKNSDNVGRAVKDFKLTYPIVQDNNYATWRAYENHYWPAKYFIGRDGTLRGSHFGEGAYDETEKKIQDLLSENSTKIAVSIQNPVYTIDARTPESYLGHRRIEYLASPEVIGQDMLTIYTSPISLPQNTFAFIGPWTVGPEYAAAQTGAKLRLHFQAKNVFLVMKPKNDKSGIVSVRLDQIPLGQSTSGKDVVGDKVTIDTSRLYDIIALPRAGQHILDLEFLDDRVEVFAFTFG